MESFEYELSKPQFVNFVFVKLPTLAMVRKVCASCNLIYVSELDQAGCTEHEVLHILEALNCIIFIVIFIDKL